MRNEEIKGIICILLVFSEKTHGHCSTSGLPKEKERAAKQSKQRLGTAKFRVEKYKSSYCAVSI